MLKFFYKILLIIIPVLALSIFADIFISAGLRKTAYKDFAGWNDIYNGNINANILINGSSRAARHFSTKIIDSTLHTQSYNMGIMGYHFWLQNFRWNLYKRYNTQPDLLVQVLSIHDLNKRKDLFLYEQFYPYYRDKDLTNVIKEYKGFSIYDKLIPFLRYTKKRELIKIGFNEAFGLKHYYSNLEKGYIPLDENWNNDFELFKKKKEFGYKIGNFEQRSIKLFHAFINECISSGQKIVLVYPPEYIEMQKITINRDSTLQFYNQICTKNKIPFLDYSDHFISYDSTYFYNSQHLNRKGAEMFSTIFAEDLKRFGLFEK